MARRKGKKEMFAVIAPLVDARIAEQRVKAEEQSREWAPANVSRYSLETGARYFLRATSSRRRGGDRVSVPCEVAEGQAITAWVSASQERSEGKSKRGLIAKIDGPNHAFRHSSAIGSLTPSTPIFPARKISFSPQDSHIVKLDSPQSKK
jgi:hypothetical protein